MKLGRRAMMLAASLLAVGLLTAQTTQSIVGTVTDQTSAAVVGATVTVKHLDTGEQRSIQTDTSGDYRITGLQKLGRYEVQCDAVGFKRQLAPEILVRTGDTVRVDLALAVGQLSESVVVEATAPLVRSEVSSLSTLVSNREVLELPLYGRNFLNLTALSAGVSTNAPSGAGYQETNLVVGGARSRDNDYRLDGIRAMGNFNMDLNSKPPIDAIEEFQMVRHQYTADQGRVMGAVVEARTKSGTNGLHGSAYWFGRRGDWSAIPYFSLTKPRFQEDQPGGSLGGPVYIPHLYDGRNRTFFFVAYERFSSPSDVQRRHYVLTDAEKAGNFSQSFWGTTVRDPLTGQPFPGAQVPASRFSKATLNMLSVLPAANQTLAQGFNWNGNLPASVITPNFVIRGDHHITNRQSVYVSTMWSRTQRVDVPALDCGNCPNRISDLNVQAPLTTITGGYNYVITPNVIFESRTGFSKRKDNWSQVDRSKNWSKEWGFGFYPPDSRTELHGTPRVTVNGFGSYFGLWATPIWGRDDWSTNLVNTLAINRGSHAIKFGADILSDTTSRLAACGATGGYSYGLESRVGQRAAEFMLGIYHSAYFQLTPDRTTIRRISQGYFIQDDWKVSRKVTVNAGLRYDYFPPYTALNNRVARYDLNKDEVIYPAALQSELSPEVRASLQFPHRFEGPSLTYEAANKSNFAPRFGLAIRPFANNNTVIRTGYGMYYALPQGFAVGRNYAVAPWAAFLNYTNYPTPIGPTFVQDQILPQLASNVYTTPGDIRMPEPGFKNAYSQQWNLTIQKSLTQDMALEIGYVGSRAVHLDYEVWGRKYAPLYGKRDFFLGNSLRLDSSGFDSRYNGLQATLEKRFSQGLSFRLNYTYSNLMNNTTEAFDVQSGHWAINNRQEWSRGEADLRHNMNFSGIYELPFGRRRTFGANWNRAVDAVLGGWKLNYIVQAHSGAPINVLWAGGSFRPDFVPGRSPFVDNQSADRWFDNTAFKAPACGMECQGNVGRNFFDGPNFFNLDLGVSKIFRITESHRVDARAEFFNATNHPNRYGAGGDVSVPTSVILRSAFPMRRLQVAVRYSF